MEQRTEYDVIVIGGGPAGATAGAVLADHGRRVVLFEKDPFPRYSVGESMIPYCYFPLARIGMLEKLRKSAFTKKYSVQFASPDGRISQPFYFQEHLPHEAAQTWQVTRGEFDRMMLDNAREKGVEVRQEVRVREALEKDGAVVGVRAVDKNGDWHTIHAPVTIDASGRNGFFATRNGWRIMDQTLKKVAVWTYYRGAKRDPGIDEGATTVAYLPENGWFWYIPLPDDIVSVGVVADPAYLYRDTRDPAVIFHREVGKNPWVERHLAPGTPLGQYRVTGDFSFRAQYCAADGVVLAGDAFAFLDPVFSTGLLLALSGGELAADAVENALRAGDVRGERFTDYGLTVCRNIEAMRKLVYSFYDPAFNFRKFFEKYPGMRADVTDILIGRTDRSYEALFAAMSEFAALPPDLPHGRAKVASTG